MSDSLWPHGSHSPWNPPGQNTGVGSLSLLQGLFPTQGLNPGLPHCRRTLYQLNHMGSPLEWGSFPFSRESSQPRDRTEASCIAGGFTKCAIREAIMYIYQWLKLNGREFEQTQGDSERQRKLASCSPCCCKKPDVTLVMNSKACLYLNQSAVHETLTQHCKATIFQ